MRSNRRLCLPAAVAAVLLIVPAADAATYCVGSPPGCSGTTTTLAGAIGSATGGGSPEDDTIEIGPGTFAAADLQVTSNPNGSLTIVGQGATGPTATVFTRTVPEAAASIDDADTTLRGMRFQVPDTASFDRGLSLYRGLGDEIAVVDAPTGAANTGVIMGEGAVLDSSSVAMTTGNSFGVQSFPTGNGTVRDSVVSACTGISGNTDATMTVERTRVTATTAFESRFRNMVVDSSAATLIRAASCTAPSGAAAEIVGDGSALRTLDLRNVTAFAKTPGFRGVRLRRDSGTAAMSAIVRSSVFADVDDTLLIEGSAPLPTAKFSASGVDPAGSASEAEPGDEPNFDDPVRGFVDQDTGDFRLLHSSALIDRGEAAGVGVATDLGGLPRVVDGKPGVNGAVARRDIGAHEYAPGLPTVAATADPAAATVGQAVTFTATGSSGDPGEGVAYHWTFSDGTSADDATVLKPFAGAGGQTATVTATDDSGWTATDSVAVAVTDPPPATTGQGDGTGPGDSRPGDHRPPDQTITPGPLELALPQSTVRLDRRGRAPVRLRCPAAAAGRCTGTLVLDTAGRVRVRGKRRVARVGRARFTIAPGATATVRLRLSRLGRGLAARRRGLRARAVATATDAAGTRGQAAKRLTVKGRRARR